MSAGAGAEPPGLAALLGFKTSTYLFLVPEREETHQRVKKRRKDDVLLLLEVLCQVKRGACVATVSDAHLTCLPGKHVDRRTATWRCSGPSRTRKLRHLGESRRWWWRWLALKV